MWGTRSNLLEYFHFDLLTKLRSCGFALFFFIQLKNAWWLTSNISSLFECVSSAFLLPESPTEVASDCMTRLGWAEWDEHASKMLRFYANTYFRQRENACENLRVPKPKILTADYFVARTTTNCARCTFVIDLCRCNVDAPEINCQRFRSQMGNRRMHNVTFWIWIMFWVRKKFQVTFKRRI